MLSQVHFYANNFDSYGFQLGDFECVALCDGGAEYAIESMVKNAPRDQVELYLQSQGLPTDRIATPYTYLYVNTGRQKILVDMGAGNLLPTTGRLLQNMESAGITAESIDIVFISHAHPDHVGGALHENKDLVFGNAQYLLWRKEWEFWFSEQAIQIVDQSFITFARQKLTPLQDRMVLLEQEEEVFPGVKVIFAPGHTPGHMVVSFTSRGEQIMYTADTVLHPLHLERPDWVPIYDILPEIANTSKHRIFDLAAQTNSLVLGQHFPPFPNLGHIRKQEAGWIWQPIGTKR